MSNTALFTRRAAGLLMLTAPLAGAASAQTSDDAQKAERTRVQANIDAAWTHFSAGQKVWGYVDRHSISQGEGFSLMLGVKPGSPEVEGEVEIARLTWKEGKLTRQFAWKGSKDIVYPQKITNTATSVGANWDTSFKIDGTWKWTPGVYVVNFIRSDGFTDEYVAVFTVKPAKRKGDVLVKLSTNTYQAYNTWGGGSLYGTSIFGEVRNKGAMVSFDRPTTPEYFLNYDLHFINWIEQYADEAKLAIDYITDFDLHDDPALMDGYKLLVSQGHDEYWSKEMFDAVEKRIFKQGKNVVFLGANTAYWQVRYADLAQAPGARNLGRQMVSFKEAQDPIIARYDNLDKALPFVTQQYRWKNRRPETMLAGLGYQSYFELAEDDPKSEKGPRFDYTVTDTSLPFFEGTGWKKGDLVKGVVGYEWDNLDPDGDGKRLWDPKASKNALIPANRIKALFTGAPVDLNNKQGLAQAVYWESPAGAKIFASGTIRWDWGFGHPDIASDAFKRFNRNLFAYLLK